MPIITISRGAFSGGQALAERVAAILGYRCLSREVLAEASKRYGIPEAKFTEVLETAPHWWERWQESLRLYRIVLQAAMCEVAQGGNLVYHGHGGQELFPGIRHVLKVHLTAPMAFRLQQVRSREGLAEAAALQYIEQVDKARNRRLQAIFGADWRDPSRYDLVLNIAQMTSETAAHLVAEAARREDYQPTPDSEQAFQDLTITARVQAELIMSPKTRNLTINVRAERGEVYVSGILAQSELEETITRLIEGVPGVKKVVADFESPPIEYMYP
ncbi:MAG: cytidylate kinase family protein [Deltaproteobacteria bacterium]|nr:cytidylate kinase family protein [Deltaproteobacteria bacterium]